MTLPLFSPPDSALLRARKISANGLCGPSCPELNWDTGVPVCQLFGTQLAVDDRRARRCKMCLQESNQ